MFAIIAAEAHAGFQQLIAQIRRGLAIGVDAHRKTR